MIVLATVLAWPFWVCLLAFLCLETYFIEKEESWSATVSLILFMSVTLVFTDWRPWETFSLGHIIGYGIAYLALVVGCAYPRWMLYVKDKCKAFESKYSMLKAQWSGDKSKYNWSEFETFEEMLRAKERMPPLPWDHRAKGKIYMWMAYWPLSATWVMLHRPLEWFWDWAYTSIRKNLYNISYKLFRSHFEGR